METKSEALAGSVLLASSLVTAGTVVMEWEGFCYTLIKQHFEGQSLRPAICNTVFFTERDQVYLFSEQFLVQTCQNQYELQNNYAGICSFKVFPYDA